MHEMFLWPKRFLWREKQRFERQLLMYMMTLGKSSEFDRFLEKVIQLGWLEMPTNSSPSILEELGIDHMNDYSSSWMKMILNSLCTSNIVFVSNLFLQTFWEKMLIFFIIILEYHLWLSELIYSCCLRFLDTSLHAILCWNGVSNRGTC